MSIADKAGAAVSALARLVDGGAVVVCERDGAARAVVVAVGRLELAGGQRDGAGRVWRGAAI